jgi:hypothetical protein
MTRIQLETILLMYTIDLHRNWYRNQACVQGIGEQISMDKPGPPSLAVPGHAPGSDKHEPNSEGDRKCAKRLCTSPPRPAPSAVSSVRAPSARGMADLPGGVLASGIFPYLDLVTHMRLGLTCHHLHANSATSPGSDDTRPWTKMIRLPSGLGDEDLRGMVNMQYSFTAVDLNGISGAPTNGVIYSNAYLNFILGLPLVKLKLCVNDTSLMLLNTATWSIATGAGGFFTPDTSGFLYSRTLQTLSMAFAPGISGHPSRAPLMEFLTRCVNLQTFIACQCILDMLGYPEPSTPSETETAVMADRLGRTFRVRVKIGGCCGHCEPSTPSETEIDVMADRLGREEQPHVIFGVDSQDRYNYEKMNRAYARTIRRFGGVKVLGVLPRADEAWRVIKGAEARSHVPLDVLE